MKYNQVTVSNDKVYRIVPAEPSRSVCLIVSTQDFYLGDAAVTAGKGLLVKAGLPYPIESTGEINGITAVDTTDALVTFLDQKYVGLGPNPGSIV